MVYGDIWVSFIGIYYLQVKRGNGYVLSDMEPNYEPKIDASIRIVFLFKLVLNNFFFYLWYMYLVSECTFCDL